MCVFCKGNLKPSMTDYIEKSDNNIILIREVPCEECEQCGEPFFDNNIVKEIERILNQIQYNISSEISLTVINYDKNVA
ncbi:MAG: type II toxin-antitoxin system MqsA family antitoxin [Oscillospiraceae bacterium]|nr:type II toxin-antitoxin system MqsA family antitoxin [Oscillospiraceae bacterium]